MDKPITKYNEVAESDKNKLQKACEEQVIGDTQVNGWYRLPKKIGKKTFTEVRGDSSDGNHINLNG